MYVRNGSLFQTNLLFQCQIQIFTYIFHFSCRFLGTKFVSNIWTAVKLIFDALKFFSHSKLWSNRIYLNPKNNFDFEKKSISFLSIYCETIFVGLDFL